MRQRLISLFLFVFLVSCGQTVTQPVQSPITPALSLIATTKPIISPSFTPALPTRTPKPSPTPLPTPKPYLIKLIEGAGDGVDEMYICMHVYAPFPKFVLYEDGQLIYYDGSKLLEVFLTNEEISNLMGRIEQTGYFKIGDSFEEHYDMPKSIQYGEGGWGVSVSVKGKNAYIHPELTQYLIDPIKDATSIIQSYQPTGNIKPYFPENIELWTVTIDAGYFPTPEPDVNVTDWLEKMPPLNKFYIQLNKSETEILVNSNSFSGVPGFKLFRHDGITYWVLACPPWYG